MKPWGHYFDRALNAVAPAIPRYVHQHRENRRMLDISTKIRREEKLTGKFYAAAHPGINRSQADQISSIEDYKQAYERIVMLRYAQQMENDIPYVESILADFETYVVGELQYLPNTGIPEADALIREHLEWRFSECDYSRELDITDMAKLAIRSKKRDGECGFIYVDLGDELRLAMIGADRIGNPMIGSAIGQNNFNGIIIDPESGMVVSYDIWRRLPKVNAYVFDKNVDRNGMIHFRDKYRVNQYHGVTSFRTAITRSVDVEQIIQFSIQNIKFRSSQLPAVQNELGKPKAPGSGFQAQAPNENGVAQPFDFQVDGVQQTYLKLGEGFVEFPHDFPNANFIEIMESLKADIAAGMHLPGEFCFRSTAGGVLQRFYIEKAQRTFDEEKRLLKRNLLEPYKNRVLRKDVDSGWLDLDRFPGLSSSMALYRGTWHMGRSVTTDYGKDTDSDIKLIDSGLMSPDEHLADNARNWEDVRRAKKKRTIEAFEDAKEISAITGRPVPEIIPYMLRVFPNPVLNERAIEDDPSLANPSGTPPPVPGAAQAAQPPIKRLTAPQPPAIPSKS